MRKRLIRREVNLIISLYVDKEMSIVQVASEVKCHPTTVHDYLKKAGVNRNLSEAQYVAVKHRRAQGIRNTGSGNAQWKGGRVKNNFGYWSLQLKPEDTYYSMAQASGYVLEHRLIMAEHFKRPLTSKELVHHLNGIRDDNRPENLELWKRKQPPGVRNTQCQHCPTCTCYHSP
ncbi:hypothetical protein LCGC14_1375730 [marine sediment metagenome]|uniref:HNH nuclease domain-containing protein n=1 Tax=marine sediment metagenome TaxID=412755 RepID=A0A0F9MJE0_9ZZZZ